MSVLPAAGEKSQLIISKHIHHGSLHVTKMRPGWCFSTTMIIIIIIPIIRVMIIIIFFSLSFSYIVFMHLHCFSWKLIPQFGLRLNVETFNCPDMTSELSSEM